MLILCRQAVTGKPDSVAVERSSSFTEKGVFGAARGFANDKGFAESASWSGVNWHSRHRNPPGPRGLSRGWSTCGPFIRGYFHVWPCLLGYCGNRPMIRD
jgi:hypothetical protein